MKRRRIISIVGSGSSSDKDEDYIIAMEMGKLLVDEGFRVLTGGLGGIMEGAHRGARRSESYREGDTIAVLPGIDPYDANPFADIVLPTGLGIGRNIVVTATSGIIAIGGRSGTLSEIAFAWQRGRPIITLDVDGWSARIGEGPIDDRGGTIRMAKDPAEAISIISDILPKENDIRQ